MSESTIDLNGRTLGGYRITGRLGAGGMGSVFKAQDEALNRFVALKVLAPELSGDRSCVERFHREARSIAAIRHPNLMHVYSVGEEGGYHFFAMEYIEGESLAALLKRKGKLALPEALSFAGQIMSALHKVHTAGLVHRDLKPGNVMIDSDRRAILVDFGLSKDTSADLDLTTAGTIMGTPDYMAPEQIEAEAVGSYTDVYSLGVVLYEMLSQVRPFHRKSAILTMRAHCETRPEPLGRLCPQLPPVLSKILEKAMAKEVARRYQAVPSFAADLLRIEQTPELIALAGEAGGAEKVKTILSRQANRTAAVTEKVLPAAPAPDGKPVSRQASRSKSARKSVQPETGGRGLLYQKIGAGCFLAFCILLVLAVLRKKPDAPQEPAPVQPPPAVTEQPKPTNPAAINPTVYRPAGFAGEIRGGELINVRILRRDDSIEDGILVSADEASVKIRQRHTGKDAIIPLAEIKIMYKVEEWPPERHSPPGAPLDHNRRPGTGRFRDR